MAHLKSVEHLKDAYVELSQALMYRSSNWNSTLLEETILSWVFPVSYLHSNIFPKFRNLMESEEYDTDIAYNLSVVHESKLFDYLVMPLNLKKFKEYAALCRSSYDEHLELPGEYHQYIKILEVKILTLYAGKEVALSISDAFTQAAKGMFPQWSISFTDSATHAKGLDKQIKTVPALYKVVEAFETREWSVSKILQQM